jgi:hypothetical protein
MRLKIEINTREHLNLLGLQEIPYKVNIDYNPHKKHGI